MEAKAYGFNTQPPEGGCNLARLFGGVIAVSTHSRPKAAAHILGVIDIS